jgi:hypothetical protein
MNGFLVVVNTDAAVTPVRLCPGLKQARDYASTLTPDDAGDLSAVLDTGAPSLIYAVLIIEYRDGVPVQSYDVPLAEIANEGDPY